MAQKTAFHNENKPDFRRVFNWGLKVTGFRELFFVSGHAASGADFQVRHPGDARAQTRYILDSMGEFLAQAGYNRDDIVRIETTVTKEVGVDDYGSMSAVMAEFLADVEVKPSVGTYRVVDRLVGPGMMVEYEFLLAR